MIEGKMEMSRWKLKPLLKKYISEEKIELDEVTTLCPRCGEMAGLRDEENWICIHCGAKGDILDYVKFQHPYFSDREAVKHIHRILGMKITDLDTIAANDLMDMEFCPTGLLIDRLLGKGVYILAGASKIGKSWLVLWLADRVSKGAPVWELKTVKTEVLYVSLEDTAQRIQQRLNDVTGGETGQIYIATEAGLLGNGFEEQLTGFLTEHPGIGFVIIDTLQRIRQIKTERYSYAGDYEVMTTLKNIADRFNITILLVHHTRKEESSDSFNMISGTTGLLGCADGAMVLQKRSRLSPDATLDVTGRELADLQLKLRFDQDTKQWLFVEYGHEEPLAPRDKILEAIHTLVTECHEWHGTATELLEQLSIEAQPNTLTRKLNASASKLQQEYQVAYRTQRSQDSRIIYLSDLRHDDNDANDAISEQAASP